MMETRTFDLKKSKNELPNAPSKQNLFLLSDLFIFHFIFGKDYEILKSQ